MDIESYKLSRTFLFRHHTLRTMRDILREAGAGLPASKCTPQWFIDSYFPQHAYPSRYKWQRINFLEDVESSDEGSSTASEPTSVNRPSDAQTHRLRCLRTIHKNEVWSIFASHSRWILSLVEKHKDLKGKVNTQSWRNFHHQIPQLTRQTAKLDQDTTGKWGLVDEQQDNSLRIGKIPISHAPLSSLSVPEVVIPQSTISGVQRYQKRSTSTRVWSLKQPFLITSLYSFDSQSVTPASHGLSASSFRTLITKSQADDQHNNAYDSDFSQGSLSPTSCYASSWLSYSANVQSPLDPSLLALIPHEMFVSPILPANMVWHCPIGGGTCLYVIDLCGPSEDNIRLISTVVSPDDIGHFLQRGWKSSDEEVYTIFYEMVNAHWEDHLKELDIKHVKQGNAVSDDFVKSLILLC